MRILVYGLNFAPELTGVGKYTGEMATWLAEQGHDVRVVTAPPYYPKWQVGGGYKSYLYQKEDMAGVDVYRCPLWVPQRPTGLKRIVHLMSFAVSSLPLMLRLAFWRPHVVWTVEPTLFCVPTALLIGWLASSAKWLHVQDFEVDAALGLNVLGNSWTTKWSLKLEGWLMRRFDRVSTISGRMLDRARTKGISEENLCAFPNWVDISEIFPVESLSVYRRDLEISNDTVVVLYSGNMGRKQGLEILADVAIALKDDGSVQFLFCGSGPGLENLERSCTALPNVRFLPLQPFDRLNELLNVADIHLLPQRADAEDLVMPSKLTGMLASGKAIIATANEGTELANVVASCGMVVPPEQPQALVDAILRLARDPQLRRSSGEKGRQYALSELSSDAVLGRFGDDLKYCVRRRAEGEKKAEND